MAPEDLSEGVGISGHVLSHQRPIVEGAQVNDRAFDMTTRGSEDRSFRKSIDGYAPIGPWLVTADEFGDPGNVTATLHVNDELRQTAETKDLIFDVPTLIAFASAFYTLHPGDVFFTGSPAGVGPVKPGDVLRARCDRIGMLEIKTRAHEIRA